MSLNCKCNISSGHYSIEALAGWLQFAHLRQNLSQADMHPHISAVPWWQVSSQKQPPSFAKFWQTNTSSKKNTFQLFHRWTALGFSLDSHSQSKTSMIIGGRDKYTCNLEEMAKKTARPKKMARQQRRIPFEPSLSRQTFWTFFVGNQSIFWETKRPRKWIVLTQRELLTADRKRDQGGW